MGEFPDRRKLINKTLSILIFTLFISVSSISSFQQSTLRSLGLLSQQSQSASEEELVIAPLTSGNWSLDQALETHLDICCILLQVQRWRKSYWECFLLLFMLNTNEWTWCFLRWWEPLSSVHLRGTCWRKCLFKLTSWTESVVCCWRRTTSLSAMVSGTYDMLSRTNVIMIIRVELFSSGLYTTCLCACSCSVLAETFILLLFSSP